MLMVVHYEALLVIIDPRVHVDRDRARRVVVTANGQMLHAPSETRREAR